MNQEPGRLSLPDRELAYQQRNALCPQEGQVGLVFLGGFASDMNGTKATFLDQRCAQAGLACLRFDYQGHGASSGRIEEGCIGDWFSDSLTIFDTLTHGPQLIVGSSMGGWIGLLLARARPERVAGFVGLAAAPDFTEDLIRPAMTSDQIEAMARDGYFYEEIIEPDHRIPITKKLMDDGLDHLVCREPLTLNGPARLIQGQKDRDVPWETALKLAATIEQDDVQVTLIKDADHRLSRPQDLALIWETIEPLMGYKGLVIQ